MTFIVNLSGQIRRSSWTKQRNSPFGEVRRGLRTHGWLGSAKRPSVAALASRRAGEGVTTVTKGLADACAEASPGPVLAILSANGKRGRRHKERPVFSAASNEDIAAKIVHGDTAGRADILYVADGPAEFAKCPGSWPQLIADLKTRYVQIFVDAGSLEEEMVSDWRALADCAFLVVDLLAARREVLERLHRDLGHSVIKFDGFIGNRRRFFIPGFIYGMVT